MMYNLFKFHMEMLIAGDQCKFCITMLEKVLVLALHAWLPCRRHCKQPMRQQTFVEHSVSADDAVVA